MTYHDICEILLNIVKIALFCPCFTINIYLQLFNFFNQSLLERVRRTPQREFSTPETISDSSWILPSLPERKRPSANPPAASLIQASARWGPGRQRALSPARRGVRAPTRRRRCLFGGTPPTVPTPALIRKICPRSCIPGYLSHSVSYLPQARVWEPEPRCSRFCATAPTARDGPPVSRPPDVQRRARKGAPSSLGRFP